VAFLFVSQEALMEDCWTCRSNSGEKRISPGPTIYAGQYWFLEHAYPTQLKGWLVIVLKRHAAALHELSLEEFAELAAIQARATRLLHDVLDCEKEYVACYAEKEGFQHVHFHVVPKLRGWPDHLKGPRSFALLDDESKAVPGDEVREFCERLKAEFGSGP
jgi:diadenosine tetraphosphate (Ap4A) HIT family hydrolase